MRIRSGVAAVSGHDGFLEYRHSVPDPHLFAFVCAKKEMRGGVFLALLPSLITLLVCFASMTYHTNGARYALPIFFLNPFILGIVVTKVPKPVEGLNTIPDTPSA